MSKHDPFELLCSLNDGNETPVKAGEDPVLDAALAGFKPRFTRSRRNPRRLIPLAALTAVVVTSGAVAASFLWGRPSDPSPLVCYSNASASPRVQIEMKRDVRLSAVEQCLPLWENGQLGNGTVPRLTACVTGSGITAVVPGEPGTCTGVGLTDLGSTGPNLGAVRDAEFSNVVAQRWADATTEGACVDAERAVALLEEITENPMYRHWTFRFVRDPGPDRPCVFPAVEPASHEVVLVPAPVPPVRP